MKKVSGGCCVLFVSLFSFLPVLSPSATAAITGVQEIEFAGDQVLALQAAPGDPDHLFVALRGGDVRVIDLQTSSFLPTPLVSVPGVDERGEGGLLGLAFHPDFQTNGRFFVHATLDPGDANPGDIDPFTSTVLEYSISTGNPLVANPSATTILEVDQPFSNHNGGWIGFNPAASSGEESYLHITIGDGGASAPGQTIAGDLLGNVLRLDVDGDDFPADSNRNYAIPTGNPFAGPTTGEDEIFAYGLRNPFQAGFDRFTGDLWIGDVGEDTREEVNVIRATSSGGENFGWDACEGLLSTAACTALKSDPNNNVVDPVYDYSRPGAGPSPPEFRGVSVVGGVVYRGPDPEVHGRYIFGDVFPPDEGFWTLDAANPVGSVERLEPELFPGGTNTAGNPVAFGEDLAGNVYFSSFFGGIYQITTDATQSGDFNQSGNANGTDLGIWETGYGTSQALFNQGDGNLDRLVNGLDFLIWQEEFTTALPLSQVPEPATCWLMLFASMLLVRRSHGRKW